MTYLKAFVRSEVSRSRRSFNFSSLSSRFSLDCKKFSCRNIELLFSSQCANYKTINFQFLSFSTVFAIMRSLSTLVIFISSIVLLASATSPIRPILPSCKKVCKENEEFAPKASSCQEHCYGSNINDTFLGCTSGKHCVCKEGYVRDPKTYKCILATSCPEKESNTTCAANEVYSDDGFGCQRTCATQFLKVGRPCIMSSGCICKAGYIRDDITSKCIKTNQCKSV